MNVEGNFDLGENIDEESATVDTAPLLSRAYVAEGIENIEAERRGEELLALLSSENISSEIAINERFGAGTWEKIRAFGQHSLHKLETSGEKTLNWAKEHGVPLPRSKIGNALLAGAFGVAGLAPGAGLLWGVSYIFAKRAQEAGIKEKSFGDMLAAHSGRTALTA